MPPRAVLEVRGRWSSGTESCGHEWLTLQTQLRYNREDLGVEHLHNPYGLLLIAKTHDRELVREAMSAQIAASVCKRRAESPLLVGKLRKALHLSRSLLRRIFSGRLTTLVLVLRRDTVKDTGD